MPTKSKDSEDEIKADNELIPGRTESRARVAARGLSDDDIDTLIKRAQKEVEPTKNPDEAVED